MKNNLELFLTGYTQVILVCLNTYQISYFTKNSKSEILLGIAFIGFLISFVWTFNVKKIAFGNTKNRIFYSLGAALGSLTGVLLGFLLYKTI